MRVRVCEMLPDSEHQGEITAERSLLLSGTGSRCGQQRCTETSSMPVVKYVGVHIVITFDCLRPVPSLVISP